MAKQRTDKVPSTEAGHRSPLLPRLLGFLLLSVFMFTAGVFVGRGTAPVQFDVPGLQARLKSLREAALRADVQRYRIDSDDPGDERPLKYREVLRQPDAPADASRGTHAGAGQPEAGRLKAPEPAPTPRPPSTAAGEKAPAPYVLQVASMKDGAAASVMVEKLKRQGYPAYRESITIADKGVWYRVRVGEYHDRVEAEKAQAALGSLARGSMVVQMGRAD